MGTHAELLPPDPRAAPHLVAGAYLSGTLSRPPRPMLSASPTEASFQGALADPLVRYLLLSGAGALVGLLL